MTALSDLALDAVPGWLTARIRQQIAAASAAGYAPLPLAVVEQVLPAMAQRGTATLGTPLDESAGRFYAALGQAPDLAAAFAILYVILPTEVTAGGLGRLAAASADA
jgi:hypothetical protein